MKQPRTANAKLLKVIWYAYRYFAKAISGRVLWPLRACAAERQHRGRAVRRTPAMLHDSTEPSEHSV